MTAVRAERLRTQKQGPPKTTSPENLWSGARSSHLVLTCADATLFRSHPHAEDGQPTRP